MIELIRKIADYIFADRKNVKERLGDIMGGKVLELESDKLIKLGRAEGRAEAQQQAIRNLVTSMNLTVKQAMDALGIPEEERYKYVDGLKQKKMKDIFPRAVVFALGVCVKGDRHN